MGWHGVWNLFLIEFNCTKFFSKLQFKSYMATILLLLLIMLQEFIVCQLEFCVQTFCLLQPIKVA